MTGLGATLLLGWLGCLVAGILVWAVSLARRDASVVDVAWGLFFVGLTAWFRHRGPAAQPFHWLHFALVAAWGLRLAAHIALRSRGKGEDPRYAAMRAAHPATFPWRSLVTVFGLQATLATALAFPLLVVQAATAISPADLAIGAALWVAGFLCEAVADRQLQRFRDDPASRGRVLDTGLWRYSRHPNYFGESLLWWGYGVIATGAGSAWALLAPLVMTFLLLRVSGVTLLEKSLVGRRPGYQAYVRRTSAFIPWPPRHPEAG